MKSKQQEWNIHHAVRQGMKLFDRKRPGWINRINLVTLNIQDPHRCAAAQVCGAPLHEARIALGIQAKECAHYGFVHPNNWDSGYHELTAAWGTAILKRRKENARKEMERIAKAIVCGTPFEKPKRRHIRTAIATRS